MILTKTTPLYISGNLVGEERQLLPLPDSDSLITVERKNLKGQGGNSACLQPIVTVVDTVYRYTYDGYMNIYSFFIFNALVV